MVIENAPNPVELTPIKITSPAGIPTQVPEKTLSPWYVFEFTNYLSPFVDLLTAVFGGILGVSSLVYKSVTAVQDFTSVWISAAIVVFDRLIFAPAFDPATKAFSKEIDYNEKRLPTLQAKFLKVTTTRFCSDYMILHDLEALEQLSNEIKKTSKLLGLYVQATGKPVPPYPIHTRVFELNEKYKKLEQECHAFIEKIQGPLLEKFQGIADMYIQSGVALPFAIHQELSKVLEKINNVLFAPLDSQESYKLMIKQARKKLADVYTLTLPKDEHAQKSQGVKLLKFNNIGNSCYISSVFQALACVDQVYEQLCQPIDPKGRTAEEIKHIQLIQDELRVLMETKEDDHFEGKLTLTEFILLINRGRKGPTVESLRKSIFESGLNSDFSFDKLGDQQDACALMGLLIENLFVSFQFKLQAHLTTKEFPGLVWKVPKDPNTLLRIVFSKDEDNKPYKRLWNLIYMGFAKKIEKDAHVFDPNDAFVVDKTQAALIEKKPKAIGEHEKQERLLDLPPVMVLQIKRFDNEMKKINEEVVLPENGIIDFTAFYDAPPNEPQKSGMYKIKSYVVHHGGCAGGHYVAYVEKGGKYYYCNDLPIEIKEITREEFLKNREAYLIVLERLTPEEILKIKAEAANEKAKGTKKVAIAQKSKESVNNKKAKDMVLAGG